LVLDKKPQRGLKKGQLSAMRAQIGSSITSFPPAI
jgi:hypothetical protein